MVFHVLKRGVGRQRLFDKPANCVAFEELPELPELLELVNEPQTDAKVAALRRSVKRGQPFGSADWIEQSAKQLGLESTVRSRGRPRQAASDE